MKELMSYARNISLVIGADDTTHAMVEIVLAVSEPVWQMSTGGSMDPVRQAETFRFSTIPDELRKLAKSFTKWADDADAIGKKFSGEALK